MFFHAFLVIRKEIKFHRKIRYRIIAALPNEMELHTDDIVTDEHGNTYKVSGFALVRLKCDGFPDWYKYISHVILSGNSENIGEYFSKQI